MEWNTKKKISVFVDGMYGTTGLEIKRVLAGHPAVEILTIPEEHRKNQSLRNDFASRANAVILCLDDDAAIEAATMYAAHPDLLIIDAGTAHRTDERWVYGMPELSGAQKQKIQHAKRIANPGCYPTGTCLMLAPLVMAGFLDKVPALTVTGISGYSGGGRKMIAVYEALEEAERSAEYSFRSYSLGNEHKHLPEMRKYSGYQGILLFTPSVVLTQQGMTIQITLAAALNEAEEIARRLKEYYADCRFIRVHALNAFDRLTDGFLPLGINRGTNYVDIFCFHAGSQLTLIAGYDNLGKGASFAAVQNLNLAFGLDEAAGLPV